MAKRVVARFKRALTRTEIDKRYNELVEERDLFQEFDEDIADFIYMEETATKLWVKAEKLAKEYSKRHPEVKEMNRILDRAFADYHVLLRSFSSATDEIDKVVDRIDEELEELEDQERGLR